MTSKQRKYLQVMRDAPQIVKSRLAEIEELESQIAKKKSEIDRRETQIAEAERDVLKELRKAAGQIP